MQISTRHRLLAIALCFAVPGCASMAESTSQNPRAALGSVFGAASGAGIAAVAGASSGWIVAAGLGGALLGGAIGHHLDAKDRQLAAQAATGAFEANRTGQAATWTNPDSGNSGTITPTRTFQQADGQYCREFQQEIVVGGQTQQGFGTACRQRDGSWQIVS
jgi:surface antigen